MPDNSSGSQTSSKFDAIAHTWLANVRRAAAAGDTTAFADSIDSQGWFRDLMTFSWEFKSLQGPDAVARYLTASNGLKGDRTISNIQLEETPEGRPQAGHFGARPMVQAALRFETPKAMGRGFVLIPYDDVAEIKEEAPPKAFVFFLMVSDWKGHEEQSYESGIYDGHNLSWEEVRKNRHEAIEKDPSVIISKRNFICIRLTGVNRICPVGAGQCGLQVAARFRQMNIKTLIIERDGRVGDVWRKRYPTLALHTPRKHHTCK